MDSSFTPLSTNAFSQLIDPAALIAVHERLGSNNRLVSRTYRPLDRIRPSANPDLAAFDAALEAADMRKAEAARQLLEAAARR